MTEEFPPAPPHPYASSKLAVEMVIEAQVRTGRLAAGIVRMLNVAGGADPDPTRLVPRSLAAAAGQSALAVNGDGTAVRDYVHIADAATAFVACLEHMPPAGHLEKYNIGSGSGLSILDVVAAVERATGRRVPLEHRPPMAEPAALISDSTKATTELDWSAKHSDIDEIVRDAWQASSAAS